MAIPIFDYFSDWRTRRLTCPACGWEGTFEEGARELFDGLQDCSCPRSHGPLDAPLLAILQFPTEAEWREHWDERSEAEQCFLERCWSRS
ncbi:MAG: hypothetical protein U0P46_08470 [Holophagaceae bacterium]|mgnify:CR=1 FL=1